MINQELDENMYHYAELTLEYINIRSSFKQYILWCVNFLKEILYKKFDQLYKLLAQSKL
jgi:hypothetical protein